MIQVKELGHVVLYVRDLERSAAFYDGVLGWRRVPTGDLPFPAAAFSGGSTHHELLLIEVGPNAAPLPPGRRLGMYHIGLKIGDSDDELRDALRDLEAAGVEIVGLTDHTVSHSIYILDPDGNEIELFVDVAGVDWKSHPELVMSPLKPLAL